MESPAILIHRIEMSMVALFCDNNDVIFLKIVLQQWDKSCFHNRGFCTFLNSQSYIIARVGELVIEANMTFQPRSKCRSKCGYLYIRRQWSSAILPLAAFADELTACEATNENIDIETDPNEEEGFCRGIISNNWRLAFVSTLKRLTGQLECLEEVSLCLWRLKHLIWSQQRITEWFANSSLMRMRSNDIIPKHNQALLIGSCLMRSHSIDITFKHNEALQREVSIWRA